MGPLPLLVYINDLIGGLLSNTKLFSDDTSSFPVIHHVDTSANELNIDLYQISKWDFLRKMSFNPDSRKQAPPPPPPKKKFLGEKLRKFLFTFY